MEDMLQVIRDIMGHTTPHDTTFQEPLMESMQLAPSLPSHETASFDHPRQIQEEYCPNDPKRQRIRWRDEMVRVLLTAASYVDGPENEEAGNIHVKGKWKCISKTMIERGYTVSPQQCEDKFNDINKKYKRLKHILGTDASCEVVENPAVMETMNIPEQVKDEVRKILTCKQLFFREMDSYQNRDRRFLPHDPSIQRSVMACLKGRRLGYWSLVSEEYSAMNKRQKLGEDVNGEIMWRLEERKMEIDMKKLELEKKKLKWMKECEGEEKELDDMKLQNQLMKLQNQRLAFHLQSRQINQNLI